MFLPNIIYLLKSVFITDFSEDWTDDAVEYFLNSPLPLPDAIVFANDNMALSAVIALEKRGISIPDQILLPDLIIYILQETIHLKSLPLIDLI